MAGAVVELREESAAEVSEEQVLDSEPPEVQVTEHVEEQFLSEREKIWEYSNRKRLFPTSDNQWSWWRRCRWHQVSYGHILLIREMIWIGLSDDLWIRIMVDIRMFAKNLMIVRQDLVRFIVCFTKGDRALRLTWRTIIANGDVTIGRRVLIGFLQNGSDWWRSLWLVRKCSL